MPNKPLETAKESSLPSWLYQQFYSKENSILIWHLLTKYDNELSGHFTIHIYVT